MKHADSPSPPVNLTATENGLGSLNISWSFTFIKKVSVDFTLTAMNLNASSAELIIVTGIEDQYYIFMVDNPASCDSYSFSVAAEIPLGNSSETIIANLPFPPNLSPVVEHSLSKTAGGAFMLNVSLNV